MTIATIDTTHRYKQGARLVSVPERMSRSSSCAIAIMAKASIPGMSKTRLVPPLTAGQAAELNSAFCADMVANVRAAARSAAIDPYLSFGPPGSADFFRRRYDEQVGLLEVWFDDFGACLSKTMRLLFGLGYGSVCVLNSDSPTLPTSLLVEAAGLLAQPGERVVIGPSSDGGYYLLGLRAPETRLFENIRWSTAAVAAQTIARAGEIGLETVSLGSWYDVDDGQSLQQLTLELATSASAGGRFAAPNSARLLAGRSYSEPAPAGAASGRAAPPYGVA